MIDILYKFLVAYMICIYSRNILLLVLMMHIIALSHWNFKSPELSHFIFIKQLLNHVIIARSSCECHLTIMWSSSNYHVTITISFPQLIPHHQRWFVLMTSLRPLSWVHPSLQLNYAEPTATDISGTAFLVSRTNLPGEFFPVGTTTITYVFSDASGNDADPCTFTINVIAGESQNDN